MFTKPVSGAKKHGPAGFVSGVGKGIFGLVTRPVKGAYTLFDKVEWLLEIVDILNWSNSCQ